MVNLEIKDLHIKYDDFHAVKGINLNVKNSDIMTLLGPSGCGKTSILRAIAGFVNPTQGQILIDNEDITNLPAQKRDMGMIFQSYALWPHMTVEANIAYGLKIRKMPREQQKKVVADLIKQVQLEGQSTKLPTQLSGGQQQRVALARALAIEPRVLLCDEPLSNLDFKLRVELRTEIRDIAKRLGVTVVYVTHDQTEALAISDKIAVIDNGVIKQENNPINIYSDPEDIFVAEFIGENNTIHGKVISIEGDKTNITLDTGEILSLQIDGKKNSVNINDELDLVTRFDNMGINSTVNSNIIEGIIKHKAYMGKFMQVELELKNGDAFTFNAQEQDLAMLVKQKEGTNIKIHIPEKEIYVFNDKKRIY